MTIKLDPNAEIKKHKQSAEEAYNTEKEATYNQEGEKGENPSHLIDEASVNTHYNEEDYFIDENGDMVEIDKSLTIPKKITVKPINKVSYYREVNSKVLGERVMSIGSSIYSADTLMSNHEEINKYFPIILGIGCTDPKFITSVGNYLNNIKLNVNSLGVTFDASFKYNTKEDYEYFTKKERSIEYKYKNADKSTMTLFNKALNDKYNEINKLESEKHKYGFPVNVFDYIMYRHCLLYSHIAKDIAVVDSNPNIRFYFVDEQKEANRINDLRNAKVKAKINYIKLCNNVDLLNQIYIMYCVKFDVSASNAIILSKESKLDALEAYSVNEPIAFNKLFNINDIKYKATIELAIARGLIIRLINSQNITTTDGVAIASNMNEAVMYYKSKPDEFDMLGRKAFN